MRHHTSGPNAPTGASRRMQRRRAFRPALLAPIGVVLAATACLQTPTPGPPVVPTTPPPADPGQPAPPHALRSVHYVADEGGLRPYTVLQPSDLAAHEHPPMVVALHGMGTTMDDMRRAADWEGAVVERRFVAVFPNGAFNAWNAGGCCVSTTNDVAVLREVVEQVAAAWNTAAGRTYVTGASNGAMMAYRLACQTAGLVDGIAPVGGYGTSACSPGSPVPTIHMHGLDDEVITFDGSPSAAAWLIGIQRRAVRPAVQTWAEASGCDPTPQVTVVSPDVTRRRWTCPAGPTELVEIDKIGHSWPSAPRFDGLAGLLDFFGV